MYDNKKIDILLFFYHYYKIKMADLENLRRTLSSRTNFYEGINISSNKYFIEFKNIYAKVFSGIKIEDTFEIPKICVVGAESVGKSSLLENITKTPIFPKDRDVCTKQPIHLIIKDGDRKIENVAKISKYKSRNSCLQTFFPSTS